MVRSRSRRLPPNGPNLQNDCTVFNHFWFRIFWFLTLDDRSNFQMQSLIFLDGLWWPPNGLNLQNHWWNCLSLWTLLIRIFWDLIHYLKETFPGAPKLLTNLLLIALLLIHFWGESIEIFGNWRNSVVLRLKSPVWLRPRERNVVLPDPSPTKMVHKISPKHKKFRIFL